MMARPLYRTLAALYENYASDVGEAEDRSRAERREEEQFLDEVMRTKVMAATLRFLRDNKVFTKSAAEFRQLLAELWFSVYSRGKRILGSSGFEHVFLGEKKNGAVQAGQISHFQLLLLSTNCIVQHNRMQGFHNWFYFHHLEQRGEVNYLGHWEAVDLGGRGTGLAFTFKWGQEQKPYG